jgi:hypothetical protein
LYSKLIAGKGKDGFMKYTVSFLVRRAVWYCLPSMNDLSVRANCVMAWRVLSEFGDTQEIATYRLNPHKFGRDTRAAAAGRMCSDNRFSSFVLKSTLRFNMMSDTINAEGLKSKEDAKVAVKKNCDKIQSRLPKRQ